MLRPASSFRLLTAVAWAALACAAAGCDMLGIESATATAGKKEAEGKAIGSACRHATRAIEDCYTLYPKALKAAVYTGWREMDEYMRENKLEGVVPVIPRPVPGAKAAAAASEATNQADGHGSGMDASSGNATGAATGKSGDDNGGKGDKPARSSKHKAEH